MGRLQEFLHDDGAEPFQNSADLLSNPSTPMRVDENRISICEGPSKATGMSNRLSSTNRTLDPIARLPPELSTLFIKNALPWNERRYRESNRPSRIIELTSISQRWQSFLCSTPVLWSELVIDETQEDFLATLSVFVAFSGKVALGLTFTRKPTDWTGLASLLLPVAQRITSLSFESYGFLASSWIPSVISTAFAHLGHLPQLKEVNFDRLRWPGDNLLRTVSLLLPSIVKLRGDFRIELPKGCWNGGTPGRFFDIVKYNTFTTFEPIPPSSNSFNLGCSYSVPPAEKITITIRSNDAKPPQFDSLAGHLAEHNSFEQAIYRTTRHLQRLDISILLSQVQDTLDCLRQLMRLQTLNLDVVIEGPATTLNWAPNDIACRALRVFSFTFQGDEDVSRIALSTQRSLRSIFSAFQTLYPSVGELTLRGNNWPFVASSYLQSLRALKLLYLRFRDTKDNPPKGSINLQALKRLEIDGPAHFECLHIPNLLKLILAPPHFDTWPTHHSLPRIRSLAIRPYRSTADFKVISLSLDYPELRDLHLDNMSVRATWELLSLSNVVSITLIFSVGGMVKPSTNRLCLILLCCPERLPALQQLHFNNSVEWDVLFLMLQRRNIDQVGLKRIDTVTLPFIPFAFQQLLSPILAGENVELPPLTSLSLEATREIMFDPTVPGCFACLHSMRPGCTECVSRRTDAEWSMPPADDIYTVESIAVETVPVEIRAWLGTRRDLINIWRASYEEFCQRFVRQDACLAFRSLLYLW